MVNDHVVHHLLLTEVFRIWLQNIFWCKDCMCPEEHAQCKVYQKSFLKNWSHACNMWCPSTRNFVDPVCRDERIPLGIFSFLTLRNNLFFFIYSFVQTPCWIRHSLTFIVECQHGVRKAFCMCNLKKQFSQCCLLKIQFGIYIYNLRVSRPVCSSIVSW